MSFADMMTLLFCLFMVLFAISSVNTSKFEALQKSLQDAFSGAVLSGGKSMMDSGPRRGHRPGDRRAAAARDAPARRRSTTRAPRPRPRRPRRPPQEEQDFRALKRRIDKLSEGAGLQGKVNVTVRRRGLVIQLLTDKVFFASGDATLKPYARKLVDKIAGVVRDERTHPVVVEGHTDSQPIARPPVPVQLGAVRRARRGGRPRLRRPTACSPAGCPSPATPARTRSPATRRPKAARRTAGWRSSSPASYTDTES